ncbi:MAG: VCBS repeat-containing protein [Deltaproteobacteria bacterium]|nr:VCBS repeat-containing protein [Deltaproteobacteria bacterium]
MAEEEKQGYNKNIVRKILFILLFLALGEGMESGRVWAEGVTTSPGDFLTPYGIDLPKWMATFDCAPVQRPRTKGGKTLLTPDSICYASVSDWPADPGATGQTATGITLPSGPTLHENGKTTNTLKKGEPAFDTDIVLDSLLTNGIVGHFDSDVFPDRLIVNYNNPEDPVFAVILKVLGSDGLGGKGPSSSFGGTESGGNMRPLGGDSVLYKDLNEDGLGDLTLVLSATGPDQTVVKIVTFLSKLNGSFFSSPRTLAKTWGAGSGPPSFDLGTLAVADFDQDRSADMALLLRVGSSGQGRVFLVYGEGDGTGDRKDFDIGKVDYLLPDHTNPSAIRAGDFDLDGRPDLAVLLEGPMSPGVQILYNEPNNTLSPGPLLTRTNFPAVTRPHGLAVGDINFDLRPDVVFGEGLSPPGEKNRVYYAFNRHGSPTGGPEFSPVQSMEIGGFVRDIALYNIDACGNKDVMVLMQPTTETTRLAVFPTKIDLGVTMEKETYEATAGTPVVLSATAQTRFKLVTPAFRWGQIDGPAEGRFLNSTGNSATFIPPVAGTYQIGVGVSAKPAREKYGETSIGCPSPKAKGVVTVVAAEGTGDTAGGLTETAVFSSAGQAVLPGSRACFYCGVPKTGISECLVEQVEGLAVDVECTGPICCFDVPDENGETISFEVSAVGKDGSITPFSNPGTESLEADETALLALEADESEEETETGDTMSFLIDEDASLTDVTAEIADYTEEVFSGGETSYSLTGACASSVEGVELSALWYSEDEDDLVVEDPSATSTSYVKLLKGSTGLSLLCTASDGTTDSTLISEPKTVTITGVVNSVGGGGGCSLAQNGEGMAGGVVMAIFVLGLFIFRRLSARSVRLALLLAILLCLNLAGSFYSLGADENSMAAPGSGGFGGLGSCSPFSGFNGSTFGGSVTDDDSTAEEEGSGGEFSDGPVDIPVSIAKGMEPVDATLIEGINRIGGGGATLVRPKHATTGRLIIRLHDFATEPDTAVIAANTADTSKTVTIVADANGGGDIDVSSIGDEGDTFAVQTFLNDEGSAPIFITIQQATSFGTSFSNPITNIADAIDEEVDFAPNPDPNFGHAGQTTFTTVDGNGNQTMGIINTEGGLPLKLAVDSTVTIFNSQQWFSDGSAFVYVADNLMVHEFFPDTGTDFIVESLTGDAVHGQVLGREVMVCKDDNTIIQFEKRGSGEAFVIRRYLSETGVLGTGMGHSIANATILSAACSYDSSFAIVFVEEEDLNRAYRFDTATMVNPTVLFETGRPFRKPRMLRDDSGFAYLIDELGGVRQIHHYDLATRIDIALTADPDYANKSPTIPITNDMVIYDKELPEGTQLFAVNLSEPQVETQLTFGEPHFKPVASDLENIITCQHYVHGVTQVTVIPLDFFDL